MAHSHLIIGHVSNNSVKIWLRAGNDDVFCPPANLSIKIYDHDNNQEVYSDTYSLSDGDSLGCHTFNIGGFNVTGSSFKQFDVKAFVELSSGEIHSLSGCFKTPPQQELPFSFFLGSCHFSQGVDHKSPEFESLNQWRQIKKPLFMMNCGDQIYIDTIQGAWFKRSLADYTNRYLDTWNASETRKFLSSMPQYMILDDHELYNNFMVPDPTSTKKKDKRKRYNFKNGITAYKNFQHSHNPNTFGEDTFYYDFKIGNAAFFVFDVRTEKYAHRMISSSQITKFREWVNSNRENMKFIISPIPFIIQLKGKQDDKWAGEKYKRQRNTIFEAIVDAGCDKVLFLTGDIHLACHAELSFSLNDRLWKFHELSSSPIKQLQGWIIERKKTSLGKNRISDKLVKFNYRLLHYMGRKKNSYGAYNYKMQNNAMNISWNPETNTVSYQSLKLNTKDLEFIYTDEITYTA